MNKGFRLFARSLGASPSTGSTAGWHAKGEVCVDSTNSSAIGGGFWPKGSPDQYVFNSGIQMAGIIGGEAIPAWAGDTTGGQFFSPRGTTTVRSSADVQHGQSERRDQLAGSCVGAHRRRHRGALQSAAAGAAAASQGDVWWMSWDGNPGLNAGRVAPAGHPGGAARHGCNFPGRQRGHRLLRLYVLQRDRKRPGGVYRAGVRPGMADILAGKGDEFQERTSGRFGVDDSGRRLHHQQHVRRFSADMDVAESGNNYASVNVPFSLGYVYSHNFAGATGWTFDPSIFSPPFFPGSGFVGVKYLKSPVVNGQEVGLTLFSNTINGGAFDDAQNTIQLYRYLSNNISPAAGDAACNTGNPQQTHICFVNTTAPDDMRFFQSSGPLKLARASSARSWWPTSSPRRRQPGPAPDRAPAMLTPGDPRLLSAGTRSPPQEPTRSTRWPDSRVPRIPNGNGGATGRDRHCVPGSLLGKATVAQMVFDNGSCCPFAPEAPDFFLIPGNNQVTVVWHRRPSERPATRSSRGQQPDHRPGGRGPVEPIHSTIQTIGNSTLKVTGSTGEGWTPRTSLTWWRSSTTRARSSATSPARSTRMPAAPPSSGIDKPVIDTRHQRYPTASAARCRSTRWFRWHGADSVHRHSPCGYDHPGPTRRSPELATGLADITTPIRRSRGGEYLSRAFPRRNRPRSGRQRDAVPLSWTRTVRNNLRYFYSVIAFDINSFQSGPSSIESRRNDQAGDSNASASQLCRHRGHEPDDRRPRSEREPGHYAPRRSIHDRHIQREIPRVQCGPAGLLRGVRPDHLLWRGQHADARLLGVGLGDARNDVPVTYTYETASSTGVRRHRDGPAGPWSSDQCIG